MSENKNNDKDIMLDEEKLRLLLLSHEKDIQIEQDKLWDMKNLLINIIKDTMKGLTFDEQDYMKEKLINELLIGMHNRLVVQPEWKTTIHDWTLSILKRDNDGH